MSHKLQGFSLTEEGMKLAESMFGKPINEISESDWINLSLSIKCLKKSCDKILNLSREELKKIFLAKGKKEFEDCFFNILMESGKISQLMDIFVSRYVKEEFDIFDEEKLNKLCDYDYSQCIEDHRESCDPGWIKYFSDEKSEVYEDEFSEAEAMIHLKKMIEHSNTPLINP